jgi:hypothetical protein
VVSLIESTGAVESICYKVYVLLWNFATVSEPRRVQKLAKPKKY